MNNTQNELLIEIRKGNKKALEEFIKQNLNLVIYIARSYENRGVELDDLIQEGMIGLYKAITKFDPSINPKFSAYASYWIRKEIKEAIQKTSRTIYIPKHVDNKIIDLKRDINELMIKLNRYPTLDEIVEKTNIPEKELIILYNYLNIFTTTNKKADYIISVNGLPEDEITFEDTIISEDPSTEEEIEQKEKREMLLQLLNDCKLRKQTIEIIKLRYGFYNGIVYTYKEIGKMLGVSFQAVQCSEANAIKKIKKNKNLIELAHYLDKQERDIEDIKDHVQLNQKKKRKRIN